MIGRALARASVVAVALSLASAAQASPPPPGASPPPPTPKPPPGSDAPAPADPPRSTTPPPPGGSSPPPPRSAEPTVPTEPGQPDAPPQDLSGTWGYSKARPTQPRYVRGETDPGRAAPNPKGFYSGVSVGGNHVPPIPPQNFDTRPATMTWTGFERAREGSRVFFEVNGPIQFTSNQKGLQVKVRMRNTKVNVRNNKRFLDLTYFDTPVRKVTVRRRGRDVEATIDLKREAAPSVQLVDARAGYKLLTVQFDDARADTGRGGADDPYRSAGGGGYVDDPNGANGGASGANGGVDAGANGSAAGGADGTDASAAAAADGTPPPPPPPGRAAATADRTPGPDGTYDGELDLFIVNWD